MRVKKSNNITFFIFHLKRLSEENKNCSCTGFLTSVKNQNSSRYSLEEPRENETYCQSSTEHQRTQPGR